ncbi:uncharacterized protein LOC129762639 isoform X2 [Toxorhynchites rutilus septentrionalis]|uniref:uncharacterized protein LOC129762639 isoform X2 n=1 Tax=Toxorhynchites rutilus septentrionalis TaxID=329112 RepID=UPI0024788CA5|nr:uncharacterized protein LOC129762639 isoform X2 [Toxorhynchites rutilus septentrionalis]
MDEEDEQKNGQHCSLCLHWINESSFAEQMVDIAATNEDSCGSLADKIKDYLKLNIDPSDTASKICLNCVHTISFIDEFQKLCRQIQNIYDSAQFCFSDAMRWQSYNNHVSELRALLSEQREWFENALTATSIVDSAVICNDFDNIASPEFVQVKVEQIENEPKCDESLIVVKTEIEVNEPVPTPSERATSNDRSTIIEDRFSRFQLKLKIAHELQAQKSSKPDLKAVGEKINFEFHEINQLWDEMVNFYRTSKKRASAGHDASIFRCRRCPLFTILNVIIPKYEHHKPYNIKAAKNNDETHLLSSRKTSINLDVAIAEEIEAHPELWDFSISCSVQSMNNAWKDVTRKLAMNMTTFRRHWRRLRDNYRAHKLREMKGTLQQDPADDQYEHLISLLHKFFGNTMTIRLPEGTVEQNEQTEGEDDVEEEHDGDLYKKEQQLALAQEFQKYPNIWCYKHPDFLNIEKRNYILDNIAENLATDRETVKREWARLKNTFHNRYLRLMKGQLQSDDALIVEPLYQVFDGMFGETTGNQKDEEDDPDKKFDNETKLEFAKACYDNDILWNMKHPDYDAQDKRNTVWALIALQFGVSQEKIRNEWGFLRDMYRSQYLHAQSNSRRKRKNESLMTPLRLLMKSMFEEQMISLYVQEKHIRTVSRYKKGIKTRQVKKIEMKPFGTPEARLKLLEEISTHDIIWNVNNPNFKKEALRVGVFEKIAEKFDQTPSIIKEEWKKLKTLRRHLKRRIAHGSLDPNSDDMDPLHALLMKLQSPKLTKTVDDVLLSEEESYPKRRYVGKRSFSDDGCIKLEVNGTVRYAKVCELCGKQVERSHFEYHMNAHYGHTPYACSFEGCDKKYSNKSIRDKHEIAVHSEDGYKFPCDRCDRKFKQKYKYEYHYAVQHKSLELPCSICGKLLPHNLVLKRHMRIHVQNYECHICGKVVQKKHTLKVHMRVHTKEKPYQCELCEQRFMLNVQLKTHLLKVHDVVLEKMQTQVLNKS